MVKQQNDEQLIHRLLDLVNSILKEQHICIYCTYMCVYAYTHEQAKSFQFLILLTIQPKAGPSLYH